MLAKAFFLNTTVKIVSALFGLALIPFLLKLLGVGSYGLWVTLSSVIGWLSILDFGVGHALKNTVSQSLATGDVEPAKAEAKQVFKFTLYVSIFFSFILLLAVHYVPVLNENKLITLVLYVPILISFPMSMGAMILQGARKTHVQSAIGLMLPGSILLFALVFVSNGWSVDLPLFAFVYSAVFVFVWVVYWWLGLKEIDCTKRFYVEAICSKIDKRRLGIGLRFFVLQLSSIVLYSSGTFLIYHYIGAESAATYDTVNKIYFFGLSLFNMVVAIFWPEISYSAAKNDFDRINKLYFFMLALVLMFVLGAVGVTFYMDKIIFYWTDGQLQVEKAVPFYFCFLVVVQAAAYSGAVVLNAIEKITVQLWISILSSLFLVPLFLFFNYKGFGIASVPLAAGLLSLVALFYCNAHALIIVRRKIRC